MTYRSDVRISGYDNQEVSVCRFVLTLEKEIACITLPVSIWRFPTMCQLNGKGSFVNRNLVAIVMIPSLIALHYGWGLLQQNEALVKKEERIDMPIVRAVKSIYAKLQGSASGESSK